MFDCHFNFFVTLIIYLTISLSLISRSSILVKDFYKHSNINTIHTWLVALFFLKILTSRIGTEMIKGVRQNDIFAKFISVSPQLVLPVEIGVPISLCWGPANLHCLLKLVFQFLCVGACQLAHYCKLYFRQLLCWEPANITL